jgi:Protein of unknown function (DUF3307)
MTADPVLVLAWLVLAHLVADFVLQPGRMARAKAAPGWSGARGLLAHGVVVTLCNVPVGLAFGAAGWSVLVVVTVSHLAIDWLKVALTRRAEAGALRDAHRRHETAGTAPDGLGPAWTPVPGALFALDQLAHVAVLVAAWAAWLTVAPLEPGFAERATGWFASWNLATVHEVVFRTVVLTSLLIVNVRAGALFVGVLVGPRLAVAGTSASSSPPAASAPAAEPVRRSGAWTLRLGPLVGRVVPDPDPASPTPKPAEPAHPPPAPPARVGEAIGILERLLIVTFVLVGAEAAIGLVIAAKTLARFRQLDDRDFAEYYLLGTLASVAVAAISAFAAVAAFGTLA